MSHLGSFCPYTTVKPIGGETLRLISPHGKRGQKVSRELTGLAQLESVLCMIAAYVMTCPLASCDALTIATSKYCSA